MVDKDPGIRMDWWRGHVSDFSLCRDASLDRVSYVPCGMLEPEHDVEAYILRNVGGSLVSLTEYFTISHE
jgi:hypothetical protein